MKRIMVVWTAILISSGMMIKTAADNEQFFWRTAPSEDYGMIIIPKDIFPEGNGQPIKIYVPQVINNSNAFMADGWETVKKISEEKVRFSKEKLLRNLVISNSPRVPEGAGAAISLGSTLLLAFEQAFEKEAFKITIQKNSQGKFRAIIEILMDEGNALKENAGSVISSPDSGIGAVAFSRYLQERFSLPDSNFLYQGFWNIDKKHKRDLYLAYVSLCSDKNALVITPKIYSNDKFGIMKVVTPFGGPTIFELKGEEYVGAWSYLVSAQPPQTLKVLELVGVEGIIIPMYSLIQKLKDEDPNVRAKAARRLGEIKDPRAVEPLIDAMKDLHREVREAAIWALGEIKDPRAVEPLIFAVKNDKYNHAREAAIWALGEIRDPSAVDLLISVLKGEIKAPYGYLGIEKLDDYAAIALRKIGGPAVKPLVSAFKNAHKEKASYIQLLAEKALRGIKDQRAVEPLIAALRDEYWKVREIAAEVLGGLKDNRAVEALIVALVDKNPIVRTSVREALKRITGKDFGSDQMKWKKWWESNLKETAQAKIDKIPMWVFEPLTHTSTHYSPRYPRRLMSPVSEISIASAQLVYFIESEKHYEKKHYEIKQKTDQLTFLIKLIVAEMKAGLKGELETLRPEVAEKLKNNLVKILEEAEEIISLAEAPAFQNNLGKIRSIQNQINETSRKIIQILE